MPPWRLLRRQLQEDPLLQAPPKAEVPGWHFLRLRERVMECLAPRVKDAQPPATLERPRLPGVPEHPLLP